MNQQLTPILLLFTDYLDNRDSFAFLRLSSSIWAAHRSPAGRYRLKPIYEYGERFLVLSKIPYSSLDSPSCGHYFSSCCRIEYLDDFYRFFPVARPQLPQWRPPRQIEFSHKIQSLQFSTLMIDHFLENDHKFPESIERITFSRNLTGNSRIDLSAIINHLPDGIKRIKISVEPIDGVGVTMDFSGFPQLTEIVWNLNLPMPRLPLSLKILELGEFFSQEGFETTELPDSIEKLSFQDPIFSQDFTHSLPAKLPRNLKILQLGTRFNDPINPGQLPVGLKTLRLSRSFNHPLELGVFPQGIETIKFSDYESNFIYPLLPGIFPDSLKKLSIHFSREYNHPILSGVLPESVESLELSLACKNYSHSLPPWPAGLKSLFYYEWGNSRNRILPPLPPQLRSIQFSDSFDFKLMPGFFPPSIEIISLRTDYLQNLVIGIFPAGIKTITLGRYNHPLPVGIFPEGIRMIKLSPKFPHRLEVGLFPSSVKHLIISTKHPLPLGLFSEGLEKIEFGPDFDEELLPGIFPSSLRSLKFEFDDSSRFQQDFLPGCLPEFLCELQLNPKYCGLFPSSALPPYFLPDPSVGSSAVPHRLKIPSSIDEKSADRIRRTISRIGRDRQFLVKSLRAPISRSTSYVLIDPLDGVGGGFLLSKEHLKVIPANERERIK